jgi:outer membrane protein
MRKSNIFWITACCLLAQVFSYGQQSFTLEEAVNYALQRSEQTKLANINIQIADAQIKEYKASGLPQVNGNASYNYFLAIPTQILPDFLGPAVDGRLLDYDLIRPEQIAPPSGAGLPAQFGTRNIVTVGAEASFMIFDAAFFAGLKAVSKAKDLARKESNQSEFEIKKAVSEAYFLVAYTETNKAIIEKNLNNLQQSLNETKALLQNGFVEQLDADRLELSFQNLQVEKEKLDRVAEVTANILKFQMNYPLDEPILLSETIEVLMARLAPTPVELGLEPYNYQSRPEYNTIEAGIKLNEIQIENIRSGYFPVLRGFVSYNTQLFRNDLFNGNENGWFPNSVAGVSLSIPIYDGNRRASQVRKSRLELDKVLVQKRQFEVGMDLQVTNARQNLNNAESSLAAREKTLRLAERIYNTTQVKYKEGVGSSIETSQAERELYNAQSAYTEALYDVLNTRYELKKAIGNL